MSWHLTPELAACYRDGALVGARAASLEAHVLRCQQCRGMLRDEQTDGRLASIWSDIEDEVDQPRPSYIERLLTLCRVPADEARLLATAPSFHMSWLIAIVAVAGGTSLMAQEANRFVFVFVILAPLLQVASVAGAYGPGLDPTYELTRSTPYPAARLLLLRTIAVLAVSLLLTALAAVTLGNQWASTAWLLPSLGLVSVTLLLARWVDLPRAGSAVAATYLFAVVTAALNDATVRSIFGGPVQLAAAAVTAACAIALFAPKSERDQIRRKL